MSQRLFIKELLKRRIPQIVGSYIIAGTSLVLFIDWLVVRYAFPQHYVTLALFGIISIIPSVMILAYFHGSPGKDEWTKIEQIGIPTNILFIAAVLFIGYQNNFWMIETETKDVKPTKYLIHISSLKEAAEIYENSKLYQHTRGKDIKLSVLSEAFLDSIRENLRLQLLSEYYDSNNEIHIPTSVEDIQYLDNYNITINDFGDTSLIGLDSIYNRFNSPRRFFTINLFSTLYNSIKQNSYFFSLVGNNCLPNKGCWQDFGEADFTDVEDQLFGDLRNLISRTKRIGQVVKIKDDIISVKLTNINIKEDMLLQAKTIYDFTSQGPKTGIIDCEDGIKYYKGVNNSDHDLLETLQTKCEAIYKLYNLPKDSLPFANISTAPFYYQLQVIEVIDSIAITKRVKVKKPFVKVRVGDKVIID